ncbi:xylulokinase [Thalassobacillus sp. CUG 92003]|uniref:xylulokinase n=1 Tax=Thalassobacillus sp. CUG 92003 TaxID=2736641 RepID=UPI0015E73387|nr:xylulokinase [Thalassobacillus sp. CUG 92003]
MSYVIGVDLGTSAVKVLLMNKQGEIKQEVSKSYPLIQEKSGYSEQDPDQWVEKTVEALHELVSQFNEPVSTIEGLSFSGQMHGLVLLNENQEVIRPAILWNDTRTTRQCQAIYDTIGEDQLLAITKNPALEGFTLPKLLWVKEHEPDHYNQASTFLLPKDYVRFRLAGMIHSEYSDAAGTLMLDVAHKEWSQTICEAFEIDAALCPPLVESSERVGTLTHEIADKTGLSAATSVFAGGADNACGAIGTGILSEGKTFCSIGTSGVVLSYEHTGDLDFAGKVHYFNHGKTDAYYTMGVTLGAGYSLNWFKEVFAEHKSFEDLMQGIGDVPIGAKGLLFTPYLAGERTPHADAAIRASFIGIDSSHQLTDFVRAVVEGITFSLNESLEIFRANGKSIDRIITSGGGAKNETWLQIQADIFNATIVRLSSEQGPGVGAAMLAAYGCEWYPSLEACADVFTHEKEEIEPIPEHVERYQQLYQLYQDIYAQTKDLNHRLADFRQ